MAVCLSALSPLSEGTRSCGDGIKELFVFLARGSGGSGGKEQENFE